MGSPETDSAFAPAGSGPGDTFPIAAIGASAGGLSAVSELLRALGAEPRLALVIVQHLDPAHQSSLVEIFSKLTPMPVHAAAEGLRVEANQVYVLRPNTGLAIEEGALKVTSRIETHGLHLVIDQFFESLAADVSSRALGVILSGSGHDGSAGIRAIKAEGGITFAQDASAEHASMPESAIATGCVDFVLPVSGIAEELARIGERAPASGLEDEEAFNRILTLLRRSTGIDFANYKHSTLRRRVERRLVVAGLSSLRAYAELLEQSPDEARRLSDEALIHVTSFFRDPEIFEALKETVFPRLLENRARESVIRVWVPGCSTGEEVYSLAISLCEFLSDSKAVEISVKLFGSDVSASTIEVARAGRYPASIEREVSEGRLARFFTKIESGYQVRKDLRDLCVFAKQDATRDPPFAGMDLISCRNLMIYLGAPLQERLLPIFHYALKEPGFLVLGTSENIRAFPGFAMLGVKHKIYARTSAAPRTLFDFSHRRLSEIPAAEAPGAKPSSTLDVQREADRLVLAEFAPPGVVITDNLAIVQFRGRTGLFLEPTPGVPSFDILKMVRDELRLSLRQTIDEARSTQQAARRTALPIGVGAERRLIDLEVFPFRVASTAQRFFVVLFRDVAAPQSGSLLEDAAEKKERAEDPESGVALPLQQELASTRDYLQAVIEQLEASNEELKAANEEIVASNEELRSTNEELQMAKEELQATNEELRTVNEEITIRTLEATRLSDDLTNVLSSVEIPIVILGRDSRVRRFTPAAGRIFQLSPHDIGRAINLSRASIPPAQLGAMIAEVLQNLAPLTSPVQGEGGRWFQLTVRPYLTTDNRIDGTVITAFDVNDAKRASEQISDARNYAESIVDTVRECLLVLDKDLRVRSANRAFHATFGVTARELEQKPLEEIGRGWHAGAFKELQARLARMDGNARLDGFRLTRESEAASEQIFLVNARRIDKTRSILLALEDVTDLELAARKREETDRTLRSYQDKLQRMAFDAVLAEERERRRIAADLHDRIGQSLALAQIKLAAIRGSTEGQPRAAIDESIALLAQSAADTRSLIFDLSPPVLYDLGLKAALSWLAEELEKRESLRIELNDDGIDLSLDDATAAVVFRAVRELLMNVIKHAGSLAASVTLQRSDHHLEIAVEDKGVGFKDGQLRGAASGFGLFSVREQIARLGGTVEISSSESGTRVSLQIPLQEMVHKDGKWPA